MVIDTTTFRLGDGVDDDAFVEVDTRYQTGFAYQQRGLVSRTLARGEDGRWLALTMWSSAEDADAAQELLDGEPPAVAVAWSHCVDAGSLTTSRYTTL